VTLFAGFRILTTTSLPLKLLGTREFLRYLPSHLETHKAIANSIPQYEVLTRLRFGGSSSRREHRCQLLVVRLNWQSRLVLSLQLVPDLHQALYALINSP